MITAKSLLDWLKPVWETGDNVMQMLPVLQDQGRKLRLISLACVDHIRHRLTDPRSVTAVAFAERYAEDGVRGRRGRPAVAAAAEAVVAEIVARDDHPGNPPLRCERALAIIVGQITAALVRGADLPSAMVVTHSTVHFRFLEWALAHDQHDPDWQLSENRDRQRAEMTAVVSLVRDVAGDPYRPVEFAPAWRTPDARALAAGIYTDRAFDRLPILADALQDAGCENADVLAHCRGDGPHVRGCWVVDRVLGKT